MLAVARLRGRGPALGEQHPDLPAIAQVLLAELDLRLQPAEGLLAALRNRPMESRDPKSA